MRARHFIATFVFAAGLAAGGTALAEPGDTVTVGGTTSVQIAAPITITKTTDLAFGKIIAPATQTAVITIQAQRNRRTGNANAVFATPNDFTPAVFAVTGPANTSINVSTPAARIELTGPGTPLTVDNLRMSFNGRAQRTMPRAETIPANGASEVRIGGRLRVPAAQTPGRYSGTLTIIVTHQ